MRVMRLALEEMMLRIRPHRPKKPILSASVLIRFFANSRRRFGLSNAAESVMDLLVDAEILADDSWAIVSQLALKFGGVEPQNPRTEVLIDPHEP